MAEEVILKVLVDDSGAGAGFDRIANKAASAGRRQESTAASGGGGTTKKDVAVGAAIGSVIGEVLKRNISEIASSLAVQSNPLSSEFERQQAQRRTLGGAAAAAGGGLLSLARGATPLGAIATAAISQAVASGIISGFESSEAGEALRNQIATGFAQGRAGALAQVGIRPSDEQLRAFARQGLRRAELQADTAERAARFLREAETDQARRGRTASSVLSSRIAASNTAGAGPIPPLLPF